MAMKMLNGFVLLTDIVTQDPSELSEGGIYMGEDTSKKYPAVGTVLSSCVAMETGVENGMKVVFMYNASTPFVLDGKTYRMIGEKALMGFVDE